MSDDTTDPLPGDDEQYDDLDFEEAALVGLLSELTALRQEVAGLREAVETLELPAPAPDADASVACQCGREFDDEETAVEHVQETHNAPDERSAALLLAGGEQP